MILGIYIQLNLRRSQQSNVDFCESVGTNLYKSDGLVATNGSNRFQG